MTLSSNPAHQLQVLRYWWMLELFSPQRLPSLTRCADRPEARQVIEWHPGDSLPWNYLQPPAQQGQRRRHWRHTIYLGAYELEATYQYLHRVFADARDAYDDRRDGTSACAVVVLDQKGALTTNSAVLSSALWAVAKVGFDAEVPNLHWASQFNWASEHFTQEVDAWEGLRRERVHAEAPVPQDADSLARLVDLARKAAGIIGMPGLDTGRVVISSVAVAQGLGDDGAPAADPLNSRFLDDLARVQQAVAAGDCPPALAAYLREDAPEGERVDVMVDAAAVDAGVSLERLPSGRWPAETADPAAPAHSLDLRQQFAVNQALNDLASTGGIVGVTAPPGTGKTAVMRDVLAGNVVERARCLADLARPEDAFTGKRLRWTIGDGAQREVHQLRPELPGFEMVVVFGADSQPDLSAFRSVFWSEANEPAGGGEPAPNLPNLLSCLSQWASGDKPPRDWAEAREAFRQAEQRVATLIQQRREVQERMGQLKHVLDEQDRLAEAAEQAEGAVGDAVAKQTEYEPKLKAAQAAWEEAIEVRRRLLEVKPGALESGVTLGRAARRWRTDFEPAEETLADAERQWTEANARGRELAEAVEKRRGQAETARQALAANTQEVTELQGQVAQDREAYHPGYPDENWTGAVREMHAPWLDEQLDVARSELFLAARRLHQDWLANAAGKMLPTLRAAVEVVAGLRPRGLEPEKLLAAWQAFFLVVPQVSAGLDSFGRMFAGLGPEALGWLVIDDAGQACPQHAVGAIWRSRRVLAVGDALQLQPVVALPRKTQGDLATAGRVGEAWIPPLASVQTLVDRGSRFGTRLPQGGDGVWVSAPLSVNRRCEEPMFGLCNELAYGGLMVSGVRRGLAGTGAAPGAEVEAMRAQAELPTDLFDSQQGPVVPTSRWIHVRARQSGKVLQADEIEVLRRALQGVNRQGVQFSQVLVVSPFKVVAEALRALEKTHPGLRAGGLRAAQGCEADVVFLVLGGDPAESGAKAWASESVNLVNVAVSRAKRRLYVIGDREGWAQCPYFKELAAGLAD